MIYATIDTSPDKPKFQQPSEPGFYERHYFESDRWLKEWWDGSKWFYVKGGGETKTQNREWRVIQSKGE